MDLANVRALINDEMNEIDIYTKKQINSDVSLINQLGQYIIQAGGKRLRPIILLLSAKALNYKGNNHISMAAVIEFIHTATLLHDDVIDESSLRRGRQTANAIWGNEASVLVGDFLYSRAFQMMVSHNNMQIMQIMADTTNTIAAGEVMQLLYCHNINTTEKEYFEVILRKTAKLFEASALIGAVLSNASPEIATILAKYGLHLGISFQLIDDLLDYSASSKEIGKNIGDDLAEGKPTLPLIYALNNTTGEDHNLLSDAITNIDPIHLPKIIKIINHSGAIEYTKNKAITESNNAIDSLANFPNNIYKDALIQLATFSAQRTH